MSFPHGSRSLFVAVFVLSGPLLAAAGSGCLGQVTIGSDGAAGGTTLTFATGGSNTTTITGTTTCFPGCGGEPPVVQLCPDGTSASPFCNLDGCGWGFLPCAENTCTMTECGTPPSDVFCAGADGGSVSALCAASGDGGCGWSFPPCPTTTCVCGSMPGIQGVCNGADVPPVCEQIAGSSMCGWFIPACISEPLDSGAQLSCIWPTTCVCLDGTAQTTGCEDELTCAQACADHGGVQ